MQAWSVRVTMYTVLKAFYASTVGPGGMVQALGYTDINDIIVDMLVQVQMNVSDDRVGLQACTCVHHCACLERKTRDQKCYKPYQKEDR